VELRSPNHRQPGSLGSNLVPISKSNVFELKGIEELRLFRSHFFRTDRVSEAVTLQTCVPAGVRP
jgi:hypothetical protein